MLNADKIVPSKQQDSRFVALSILLSRNTTTGLAVIPSLWQEFTISRLRLNRNNSSMNEEEVPLQKLTVYTPDVRLSLEGYASYQWGDIGAINGDQDVCVCAR